MTRPKPTTLDELRSMSREELMEVEEYLYRGDLTIKYLIQDFARLAAEELEWRGEENSMSLRGFWYSGVKQMLENAFPGKARDPDYKFSRRMSQNLSDVLSEMVQDGELTYRDLNIVDDSRDRKLFTESVEDDKLLFVEKAAVYRQLRPLAEVFEFTLVSGGGWEATALIEDLAYALDSGTSYELYVLSDYDPTGDRIVEDFERRSNSLGLNIASVEKVGIYPRQLDAETVEVEKFRPPVESDYDRRWMDENAIDGQFGLEIEAIGDLQSKGEEMRELVADELFPVMDVRRRRERDENVSTANMVSRVPSNMVEEMSAALLRELKRAAVSIVSERDPVNSLRYDEAEDRVSASVDLDAAEEGDELVPNPYDASTLKERAIAPDFNSDGVARGPVPSHHDQQRRLREELQSLIADGEISPADLLDL